MEATVANQDWTNLGDKIRNAVQDAIDSQNFNQLNQTIGDTVHSAMDGVNSTIHYAGEAANQAARTAAQAANQAARTAAQAAKEVPKQATEAAREAKRQVREQEKDLPSPFVKTTSMRVGGYALFLSGGIVAGALGIALLIMLIIILTSGVLHSAMNIGIAVILPFFLGSSIMTFFGNKALKRVDRFRKYVKELHGREYCSIKELGLTLAKSDSFLVRDLKDMIAREMFKEGHLDQQETCLMVTQRMYEQYQAAQKQLEEKQREIEEERLHPSPTSQISKEVEKVIEEGNEYLRKIKESNDAIPGVEVSEKISKLEDVIQKIFQRVQQHPELIPELRKFMDYYLPTTVKLLDAYEELDAQPIKGANITTAKREIEKTLDTIHVAFENLLDSFFKDTAWDISTDISVLETMLAQEGLTKKDFTKGENHE